MNKLRPTSLSGILGQEKVIDALKISIKSAKIRADNLHHTLFYGPPGTGKTTLVKDGFSKMLGRDFKLIALGGMGDASEMSGHSYTYEGAVWGKLVEILRQILRNYYMKEVH